MLQRSVFRAFYGLGNGPTKQARRRFRVPAALAMKQMPPRPTIKEEDIEEAFLKGSGPGGQKIVRTSYQISQIYGPLLSPSTLAHPPHVEQNILRRPIETPPNGPGHQVPGHAL